MMIFVNDPFEMLDEAFQNLHPEKEYKACIEPELENKKGNTVHGFTQFNDDETPIIAISAELTIKDAVEIFAHELAHVATGKGVGHGEKWEQEYEKIFREYNRIGNEMFPEQED